jgi:hypothetical protein
VKRKNPPHKTGLKKFYFVINLEQRGVDAIQKKLFSPASLGKRAVTILQILEC